MMQMTTSISGSVKPAEKRRAAFRAADRSWHAKCMAESVRDEPPRSGTNAGLRKWRRFIIVDIVDMQAISCTKHANLTG